MSTSASTLSGCSFPVSIHQLSSLRPSDLLQLAQIIEYLQSNNLSQCHQYVTQLIKEYNSLHHVSPIPAGSSALHTSTSSTMMIPTLPNSSQVSPISYHYKDDIVYHQDIQYHHLSPLASTTGNTGSSSLDSVGKIYLRILYYYLHLLKLLQARQFSQKANEYLYLQQYQKALKSYGQIDMTLFTTDLYTSTTSSSNSSNSWCQQIYHNMGYCYLMLGHQNGAQNHLPQACRCFRQAMLASTPPNSSTSAAATNIQTGSAPVTTAVGAGVVNISTMHLIFTLLMLSSQQYHPTKMTSPTMMMAVEPTAPTNTNTTYTMNANSNIATVDNNPASVGATSNDSTVDVYCQEAWQILKTLPSSLSSVSSAFSTSTTPNTPLNATANNNNNNEHDRNLMLNKLLLSLCRIYCYIRSHRLVEAENLLINVKMMMNHENTTASSSSIQELTKAQSKSMQKMIEKLQKLILATRNQFSQLASAISFTQPSMTTGGVTSTPSIVSSTVVSAATTSSSSHDHEVVEGGVKEAQQAPQETHKNKKSEAAFTTAPSSHTVVSEPLPPATVVPAGNNNNAAEAGGFSSSAVSLTLDTALSSPTQMMMLGNNNRVERRTEREEEVLVNKRTSTRGKSTPHPHHHNYHSNTTSSNKKTQLLGGYIRTVEEVKDNVTASTTVARVEGKEEGDTVNSHLDLYQRISPNKASSAVTAAKRRSLPSHWLSPTSAAAASSLYKATTGGGGGGSVSSLSGHTTPIFSSEQYSKVIATTTASGVTGGPTKANKPTRHTRKETVMMITPQTSAGGDGSNSNKVMKMMPSLPAPSASAVSSSMSIASSLLAASSYSQSHHLYQDDQHNGLLVKQRVPSVSNQKSLMPRPKTTASVFADVATTASHHHHHTDDNNSKYLPPLWPLSSVMSMNQQQQQQQVPKQPSSIFEDDDQETLDSIDYANYQPASRTIMIRSPEPLPPTQHKKISLSPQQEHEKQEEERDVEHSHDTVSVVREAPKLGGSSSFSRDHRQQAVTTTTWYDDDEKDGNEEEADKDDDHDEDNYASDNDNDDQNEHEKDHTDGNGHGTLDHHVVATNVPFVVPNTSSPIKLPAGITTSSSSNTQQGPAAGRSPSTGKSSYGNMSITKRRALALCCTTSQTTDSVVVMTSPPQPASTLASVHLKPLTEPVNTSHSSVSSTTATPMMVNLRHIEPSPSAASSASASQQSTFPPVVLTTATQTAVITSTNVATSVNNISSSENHSSSNKSNQSQSSSVHTTTTTRSNRASSINYLPPQITGYLSISSLLAPGPYPDQIDVCSRELYLSPDDFLKVFQMNRQGFYSLPKWKQIQKKKQCGLF